MNHSDALHAHSAIAALEEVQHLVSTHQLNENSQRLVAVCLEAIAPQYGVTPRVATEALALESVSEYIVRVIKAIMAAIVDTLRRLFRDMNAYRIRGHFFVRRAEDILEDSKSLTDSNLRARVGGEALALALNVNGVEPRFPVNHYKAMTTMAGTAIGHMNLPGLESALKELAVAEGSKVDEITVRLLQLITAPARESLKTLSNFDVLGLPPPDYGVDLLSAGPFPGNRFVYAYCPREPGMLREYRAGYKRDTEKPVRIRDLSVLKMVDVWSLCNEIKKYGEELVHYGSYSWRLQALQRVADDLSKQQNAARALTAAAVYPAGLRGLHKPVLDLTNQVTENLLRWCNLSVEAHRRANSKEA